MKPRFTKAVLLSVALIGTTAGSLPAFADNAPAGFHNPALVADIRAQGERAVVAISANIKADLLMQIRSQDVPRVVLGPVRVETLQPGGSRNPELAAAIRAQGEQAVVAISAEIKADLLTRIRTQELPYVAFDATRLAAVEKTTVEQESGDLWVKNAQSEAAALEADMELWLKSMLFNSTQSLAPALSLSRFISIDMPQAGTAK